jgi:hypothetical protein
VVVVAARRAARLGLDGLAVLPEHALGAVVLDAFEDPVPGADRRVTRGTLRVRVLRAKPETTQRRVLNGLTVRADEQAHCLVLPELAGDQKVELGLEASNRTRHPGRGVKLGQQEADPAPAAKPEPADFERWLLHDRLKVRRGRA